MNESKVDGDIPSLPVVKWFSDRRVFSRLELETSVGPQMVVETAWSDMESDIAVGLAEQGYRRVYSVRRRWTELTGPPVEMFALDVLAVKEVR